MRNTLSRRDLWLCSAYLVFQWDKPELCIDIPLETGFIPVLFEHLDWIVKPSIPLPPPTRLLQV